MSIGIWAIQIFILKRYLLIVLINICYFLEGLFLLEASMTLLAANKEAVISLSILLAAVGLLGSKIKLLLESAPIDCKVS